MAKHKVYFTVTEVTRRVIEVEAPNLSEAIRIVEEGEIETQGAAQVDCLLFSHTDASEFMG